MTLEHILEQDVQTKHCVPLAESSILSTRINVLQAELRDVRKTVTWKLSAFEEVMEQMTEGMSDKLTSWLEDHKHKGG